MLHESNLRSSDANLHRTLTRFWLGAGAAPDRGSSARRLPRCRVPHPAEDHPRPGRPARAAGNRVMPPAATPCHVTLPGGVTAAFASGPYLHFAGAARAGTAAARQGSGTRGLPGPRLGYGALRCSAHVSTAACQGGVTLQHPGRRCPGQFPRSPAQRPPRRVDPAFKAASALAAAGWPPRGPDAGMGRSIRLGRPSAGRRWSPVADRAVTLLAGRPGRGAARRACACRCCRCCRCCRAIGRWWRWAGCGGRCWARGRSGAGR